MKFFADAYVLKEIRMYVNRVLLESRRGRRITRKNFCPDHAHVAELAYRNSLRTRRLGVGIPPWVLGKTT